MFCEKCKKEFSDTVYPLHIQRCPGKTPTKSENEVVPAVIPTEQSTEPVPEKPKKKR